MSLNFPSDHETRTKLNYEHRSSNHYQLKIQSQSCVSLELFLLILQLCLVRSLKDSNADLEKSVDDMVRFRFVLENCVVQIIVQV